MCLRNDISITSLGDQLAAKTLLYVESIRTYSHDSKSTTINRVQFEHVVDDYYPGVPLPEVPFSKKRNFHWVFTHRPGQERFRGLELQPSMYYTVRGELARYLINPQVSRHDLARAEEAEAAIFEWNEDWLSKALTFDNGAVSAGISDADLPVTIRFLSVGNGDSALVEMGRQRWIIDGNIKASGRWGAYGITKQNPADFALVTHRHRDHLGGVLKGIGLGLFKQVILGYSFGNSPVLKKMIDVDSSFAQHIRVLRPESGDLAIGPNLTAKYGYQILSRTASDHDANSHGIQLLLSHPSFSVWLGGDAEQCIASNTVAQVLTGTISGKETIYLSKVCHHGSENGLTDASVFGAQRPDAKYLRIISTGNHKGHRHPDCETIHNCLSTGNLWRTDVCGDISIQFHNAQGGIAATHTNLGPQCSTCLGSSWCGPGSVSSACQPTGKKSLCDGQAWKQGRCR